MIIATNSSDKKAMRLACHDHARDAHDCEQVVIMGISEVNLSLALLASVWMILADIPLRFMPARRYRAVGIKKGVKAQASVTLSIRSLLRERERPL